MPRPHSTGISTERHEALMSSVDARAERRAEILAALPVSIGQRFRGRERDHIARSFTPPSIPENALFDMGARFRKMGGIITSKFTENMPVLDNPESYRRYTTAGNKNNKRIEVDPEEKRQARTARQRQTQHVTDKLHRETWLEWQTAKLYGAASMRVKQDIRRGEGIDETAGFIGLSALEDFGHSLLESGMYSRMHNGGTIARAMIGIALHGVENEGVIRAQSPTLFLVVQREQERRAQLWGDMLGLYEQPIEDGWGGYRRTAQDQADERENQALINTLILPVEPVE